MPPTGGAPGRMQMVVDVGVGEVEVVVVGGAVDDVEVGGAEVVEEDDDAESVEVESVIMVLVVLIVALVVVVTGGGGQLEIVFVSRVTAALSATSDPTLDTPVVTVMAVLAKMTPMNWVPVPRVAELPT